MGGGGGEEEGEEGRRWKEVEHKIGQGGGGEGKRGRLGGELQDGGGGMGEGGNRATFTIAYLMSSSPLGRGICCKIDANCLTLSSSRGDCCHSNQRRFGASKVKSGCPGGRTGRTGNGLRDISHGWFKRHTSPLQSYVQMKKEGEREGEREGLMLTSLI